MRAMSVAQRCSAAKRRLTGLKPCATSALIVWLASASGAFAQSAPLYLQFTPGAVKARTQNVVKVLVDGHATPGAFADQGQKPLMIQQTEKLAQAFLLPRAVLFLG